MELAPNTDPGLPHPRATGLTAAICGFAALGLATVLGLSLACGATNGPGGDAPITIVTRPSAADAAMLTSAASFEVAGCTVTAAARP
jgi:hypothetical protein